MPSALTTATAVAAIFVDHWLSNLAIPWTVLSDNGSQLTSKYFQAVCAELHVLPLWITRYHLETNEQVQRNNETIVFRLRHHVTEYQQELDKYVAPLGYDYNIQVHRFTKPEPLCVVLSQHPPGPASTTAKTMPPDVDNIDLPPTMLVSMINCSALLGHLA